jgi:hypothetical protein
MNGRGSIPFRGKAILFSTSSRPALWPNQPRIESVPGALSALVKRPGHESYQSPPCGVEMKNGGVIPPLYQRIHGMMIN